jgi:hypothetical protein
MIKFVGTLLLGILSASLAVIYQNDIAAFLGRAPVTVRVTAGGWYPHPETRRTDKSFSDADELHIGSYAQPKESNFARLTISNNTGRDIPNSVIKVGDENTDIWKYDAVVLTKEKGKLVRTVVEDATDRIEVGALPAAQDTIVYLWSNRGFSYPYGISDIEVLTTDGRVPRTVANIEGTSANLVFGVSTETVAWVFVFVLLALCVLLLFVVSHGFSFAKSLLKDEDYYLSERVRFDSSPETYSVPDTLPKT